MPMVPEHMAQVVHEAMRAYVRLTGGTPQLPWLEAGDQQSTIDGVKFVLANPKAGDAGQLDAWMNAKLLDGWMWGETLDRAAKRHPNLIPFDELPPTEQAKDRLFRAVVNALAG